MKGSYILLLRLPERRSIAIGRLGVIDFPRGFYAYVGSALNGLEARIGRHLRRTKRLRWHIDYLLEEANISEVITVPGEQKIECAIARALASEFSFVPHFGSSDCRCQSHLFFAVRAERLRAELLEIAARHQYDCQLYFSTAGRSPLKRDIPVPPDRGRLTFRAEHF